MVLSLLGGLPRGRFASVDEVAVALEGDLSGVEVSPAHPLVAPTR
jgi:hypothetical protein